MEWDSESDVASVHSSTENEKSSSPSSTASLLLSLPAVSMLYGRPGLSQLLLEEAEHTRGGKMSVDGALSLMHYIWVLSERHSMRFGLCRTSCPFSFGTQCFWTGADSKRRS